MLGRLRQRRTIAATAVFLFFAAGSCAVSPSVGSGGSAAGGSVSVLGVWGGNELESFRAMVRPFEQQTGTRVQFEGTRDMNAVLTTRVKGGNPPDVALPMPGQIQEFARAGKLVPVDSAIDLSAIRAQYAKTWTDLTVVNGKRYGVVVKAALKGLIWYNPGALQPIAPFPKTWDALLALTDRLAAEKKTPWCIGLESGAASGWPATDWIEILLLRTAGAAAYDQWYRHEIPWTHPAIKQAWSLFGRIAATPKNVHGGVEGELSTNFGESPFPLFANPPGCYFHLQASFIQDFIQKQYPRLRPGVDLAFAPFPVIVQSVPEATEIAGDVAVMFRDTPQSRSLIRYLTTAEAQAIWVKRGGALSPNRRVGLPTYPDPLSRKAAELLTAAKVVRFDADDLMPQAVSSAFLKATLEYVQHPDHLDQILRDVERVAAEAGKR
jgi:alpha-glucoside transport system substrate-binding protein